jgi:hypothetical protein
MPLIMPVTVLAPTNLVQELYEQDGQDRKASNHGTHFLSNIPT